MSNISPFTNDSSGPFLKGKIFDMITMSNILSFTNGPEESFVKGEIFYMITMQEYSRSFEDVSSNTVIYFRGIPKEFRGNMTVLLEISDKDPLYSHCYQVKH